MAKPKTKPRDDLHAVQARVTEVRYLPNLSETDSENPFWTWGYRVEIHNGSNRTITVVKRHWTIQPFGEELQTTDGFGVGGRQLVILPRATENYYSGVPLPTGRGGAMEGYLTVRTGDGETRRVAISRFDLKEASTRSPRRVPITVSHDDRRAFNDILNRYIAYCGSATVAELDTASLPDSLKWPFQRLCLSRGKTSIFNSQKQGELSSLTLTEGLHAIIDATSNAEYNDILLHGDDFKSLRVKLLFLTDVIVSPTPGERWAKGHIPTAEDLNNALEHFTTEELEQELERRKSDDSARPRWTDDPQQPYLSFLSAPAFLKVVWKDVLGENMKISKRRVRKHDEVLMSRVEAYISNRIRNKCKDLGDAEGITFIVDGEKSANVSKRYARLGISIPSPR